MLAINGYQGALFMISSLKNAYNELMNAKDLGAKWIEIDEEEMAIKIKDENYKHIGAIYGNEYFVIRFVIKYWMEKEEIFNEIFNVIFHLRSLIKKNNKIYDNGVVIGKVNNYAYDVE